ncbi:MAG: HAD family phosphatase [Clostridia bacterium]|nr:HAD family phosphatase [Clostridia bacterium]
MIRLIATDLDNTLLDSTGAIPESTAALLQRAAQQGVCTAVATGRCYPSALAAAKTIGAATPVICYNGSLIKRGDTGEVLASSHIVPSMIRQVSEYCHANDLYLQCYDQDDVLVIEELCDDARLDPDLPLVGCREVGDLRLYAGLKPTPKMLIVEQPDRLAERMADLQRSFPRLSFCQSQPWLIEVMPPDADKGRAVAKLAALLGIPRAQVMTLGDNTNDLSMIRWAGKGVAVGNAVETLKREADYVCTAHRSLGVEEALKTFVFS